MDLTDPIGQAARLFEDPFYEKCERALRADGILVAQTESVHFHPNTVRQCYATLSQRFARTELLWGAIATYPGSFWTFAMATKGIDPTVARRQPALTVDTKQRVVDRPRRRATLDVAGDVGIERQRVGEDRIVVERDDVRREIGRAHV